MPASLEVTLGEYRRVAEMVWMPPPPCARPGHGPQPAGGSGSSPRKAGLVREGLCSPLHVSLQQFCLVAGLCHSYETRAPTNSRGWVEAGAPTITAKPGHSESSRPPSPAQLSRVAWESISHARTHAHHYLRPVGPTALCDHYLRVGLCSWRDEFQRRDGKNLL